MFFFFKQKTAYEMRISDWSSDVCSSDLLADALEVLQRVHVLQQQRLATQNEGAALAALAAGPARKAALDDPRGQLVEFGALLLQLLQYVGLGLVQGAPGEPRREVVDRKSVVVGKSVSARVELGGGGIIKKN